jgi:hypothetical protein
MWTRLINVSLPCRTWGSHNSGHEHAAALGLFFGHKSETVRSSEKTLDYQTSWRHIPEVSRSYHVTRNIPHSKCSYLAHFHWTDPSKHFARVRGRALHFVTGCILSPSKKKTASYRPSATAYSIYPQTFYKSAGLSHICNHRMRHVLMTMDPFNPECVRI